MSIESVIISEAVKKLPNCDMSVMFSQTVRVDMPNGSYDVSFLKMHNNGPTPSKNIWVYRSLIKVAP